MSANTSAGTSDPTAMGRNFPDPYQKPKRRKSAALHNRQKLRTSLDCGAFSAALVFLRVDPYRPGLRPGHPTRSGWEGTSWDPIRISRLSAARESIALGGVYGHSACGRGTTLSALAPREQTFRGAKGDFGPM